MRANRLSRLIGRRVGVSLAALSAVTVEAQTAEFGADTISARFRPLDTNGNQALLTGTPTLQSGSSPGHTPSISDGGLIFDAAGGPDGAVFRCTRLDGGGTVDITISETANCKVVASLADADTAAQAYEAADDTATVAVALRDGTYANSSSLDNVTMSSTDITGIGETRGAARNPTFDGGSLTFRPAAGETVILTGQTRTGPSGAGVCYDGLEFRNGADTTESIAYEPETAVSISALTVGTTTTVRIAVTGFTVAQIEVGDQMALASLTTPHDVLNGGPYDVLSITDNGATVDFELDVDSSALAAWSSGGTLAGYAIEKSPNPVRAVLVEGVGPYLFQNCFVNNRALYPSAPGRWAHGFYIEIIDTKAVFYNNHIDGCEHAFTGGTVAPTTVIVDNLVDNLYEDFFAARDTDINDEWMVTAGTTAGSISNITESSGVLTVTTSAPHGLSAGDCILIRDVTGMTEINNSGSNANTNGGTQAAECFYVSPNNLTATAFEVQEQTKTGNDDFQDVDGSGFTAYVSGGTVYGPLTYQLWVEGNYVDHGSPSTLKAKHSDFIQLASSPNRANLFCRGYDNFFIGGTRFGYDTQFLLGSGGNDDPTFSEHDFKGNFGIITTFQGALSGGKSRTGQSVMDYNTVLRGEPLSFPENPSTASYDDAGDAGQATQNIIGTVDTGSTISSPRDNLEVQHDDLTSPTYADVFPNGNFASTDVNGVTMYSSPSLAAATRSITGTLAERKAAVVALLTPADDYKAYGATADPDSPHYVPVPAVVLNTALTREVDTANLSSYSFTPALSSHANKVVLVAVMTFSSASGNGPTAVTVGGASATKRIGTVPTDTTYDATVSIWQATLGSSPTDTLAITMSGTANACAVDIVVLDNAAATVSDTLEVEQGTAAASSNGSIDTPEGGFMFMAGVTNGLTTSLAFSGDAAITANQEADLDSNLTTESAYRDGVAGTSRTAESVTLTLTGVTRIHRWVAVTVAPA